MSEKRSKQIRGTARRIYKFHLDAWQITKPSIWRIFQYLKWKKAKPVYKRIEKQLKDIAKRGVYNGRKQNKR